MKSIPYPVRKLASNLILKAPIKKSKVMNVKAGLLGAKGAAELYEISNEEEPLAKEICQ